MKMKIFTITMLAFCLTALTSFKSNYYHTDVYKVDVNQSVLEWFAEKLTGKHNGTIKISGGVINNNHGNLTGTFEIDMNSIEDLDIKDETYKLKLEKHLKSADFFDAENFPKAKFVMLSATPKTNVATGGYTHTVKGMLTIRDKTNEIVFDANIKFENNTAYCTGSVVVDRSKYDVKYGSKTFYESIGDKMIYDEFILKFNVVAMK